MEKETAAKPVNIFTFPTLPAFPSGMSITERDATYLNAWVRTCLQDVGNAILTQVITALQPLAISLGVSEGKLNAAVAAAKVILPSRVGVIEVRDMAGTPTDATSVLVALTAQVAATVGAEQSAEVALAGLASALQAAMTNSGLTPDQLTEFQSLLNEMQASQGALTTAIAANPVPTPATPPAGT